MIAARQTREIQKLERAWISFPAMLRRIGTHDPQEIYCFIALAEAALDEMGEEYDECD